LCGALQITTNAFLYTYIHNILSELISEPTTVDHILVNNINNIAVNIAPIIDLLTPDAIIDTLTTEHIATNKWNNNEMYTLEITHARFAQNTKNEKFPMTSSTNTSTFTFSGTIQQQSSLKKQKELSNKVQKRQTKSSVN
jgi:hypothetical protein